MRPVRHSAPIERNPGFTRGLLPNVGSHTVRYKEGPDAVHREVWLNPLVDKGPRLKLRPLTDPISSRSTLSKKDDLAESIVWKTLRRNDVQRVVLLRAQWLVRTAATTLANEL